MAEQKTWRQCELIAEGDSHLVCWIEDGPALEPGTRLTLKEIPDVVWTIVHAYKGTRTDHPRRTWNVGGLRG